MTRAALLLLLTGCVSVPSQPVPLPEQTDPRAYWREINYPAGDAPAIAASQPTGDGMSYFAAATVEAPEPPRDSADQRANFIITVKHPPTLTPDQRADIRATALLYWSEVELVAFVPEPDPFTGGTLEYLYQWGHSFRRRGSGGER